MSAIYRRNWCCEPQAYSGCSSLRISSHGPNEPCKGKIGDINMMVRSGGRNRTEAELGDLLFASGFQVLRMIPTDGPDLLEASLRS